MKDIKNALSNWLNSLMGKPANQKSKIANNTKTTPKPEADSSQEQGVERDRVHQDLINVKNFIRKSTTSTKGKISKTITDVSPSQKDLFKNILNKIIKILIIFAILLITIYLGKALYEKFKPQEDYNIPSDVSPTPQTYQPYKPSMWADDPEVLLLEEDISVLKQEIGGANIREGRLNPPNLDFDISF